MIIAVTPNPALDVSYTVDRLRPGHAHRVKAVHGRAGGKGINVGRVLHELGVPATVVGPVGGAVGEALRADLTAAGIPHELVSVAGPTRMTVTVVPVVGEATLFNEPGSPLAEDDWDRLVTVVTARLAGATALVCSGSLPPGLAPDACATLVRLARERAVPAVIDATGEALRLAAEAGADVLKPNRAELRETTARDDVLAGARELRRAGARAVVVSLGADGMLAVTGEGEWRARPPTAVRGNATGAGDAAVAAIATGLTAGTDWPDRLRFAVALSMAAVVVPVAGGVDRDVLARVRDQVSVEPV